MYSSAERLVRSPARAARPASPGPTIWFDPVEWQAEQPFPVNAASPAAASPDGAGAVVGCGAMNFINNKDRVGSSLILLAALVYLNAAFEIPINQVMGDGVFTARTIPIALSSLTIVVCLVQI